MQVQTESNSSDLCEFYTYGRSLATFGAFAFTFADWPMAANDNVDDDGNKSKTEIFTPKP